MTLTQRVRVRTYTCACCKWGAVSSAGGICFRCLTNARTALQQIAEHKAQRRATEERIANG